MNQPAGITTSTRQLHVGFYVHYHGLGHKRRTEQIIRRLSTSTTVISSRFRIEDWSVPCVTDVIDLACDIDDVNDHGILHRDEVTCLHYAPLWCDNITRRVAQYSAWLDQNKPDVMVVDVSAEISLLTRLASIPLVVMRQHGVRDDAAHCAAYQAADSLLAPFPRSMEDDITPDWVRKKTCYLSGFGGEATGCQSESPPIHFDRPTVVVMFGRGGSEDVSAALESAAAAVPNHDWVVIGKSAARCETPPNLHYAGWIADPTHHLKAADVIVTAAGHNSVMEIGRLGRPFIAIAEDRPFDEQLRKVHVLNREGLAVGVERWPTPDRWHGLIAAAGRLDGCRWQDVFAADGADQAAVHLERVAAWSYRQRHQTPTLQTADPQTTSCVAETVR